MHGSAQLGLLHTAGLVRSYVRWRLALLAVRPCRAARQAALL